MERKYVVICIFILLLCRMSLTIYAEEEPETVVISQVDAVMPVVRIYLNKGITEEEALHAEAFLGEQRLQFKQFGKASDEGVLYYILLDRSASIPDVYFTDIKNGIQEFIEQMRPVDEAIIYTFGDEILPIYTSKNNSESIEEALNKIHNTDQNTLLFEAIETVTVQMAFRTDFERKVMLTITDGEDFAVGRKTKTEALNSLKEKGIPMYAMTVDTAQKEYIDSFGEFARNSGGEIFLTKKEESAITLNSIKDVVTNISFLDFFAPTNRVSNQMETLALTLEKNEITVTKDILITRGIPDKEEPNIISVEKISDKELKVFFSEAVLNADKVSSFKVLWNDVNIPIQNVLYLEKGGKYSSELFFAEELYEGDYQIEGINITDNSQEENLLKVPAVLFLNGVEYIEPEQEKDHTLLWTILVSVGIIMIFISTGIFLYRKIKKNKGIIYVDGKPILVSNVEQHESIPVEKDKGRKITLIIYSDGRNTRKIDTVIDKSLFFGRAPICNYYFDDASLSK